MPRMTHSRLSRARLPWRLALVVAVSGFLVTACTQTATEDAYETSGAFARYLKAEPRIFIIEANDLTTHPALLSETTNTGSRAAAGAGLGALAGAGGFVDGLGRSSCSGMGCGAVILLLPVFVVGGAVVGGVAGAATAHTVVTPYALPEYEEVYVELVEFVSGLDPGAMFSDSIQTEVEARTGQVRRSGSSSEMTPLPWRDAIIRFDLQIAFIGDSTEDTNVALRVLTQPYASFPYTNGSIAEVEIPSLRYESDEREFDEWMAPGFALIQSELKEAAQVISRELASALFDQPKHRLKWVDIDRLQYAHWLNEFLTPDDADSLYHFATVSKSADKRWEWLCRAANKGHSIAQFEFGNLYLTGSHPVLADRRQAQIWYALAAKNGHVEAAAQVENLRLNMSAEQIAEIERELEIWQPDEGSCRAREAYLETYPYSPLRAPQARPLSNSCTTTENAERPWEGYWRAARDDATLTLEIGEQKVSGTLKVRAKRYPVSGTVDETGYVRAVIDAAPGTLGGPGRLSGAFPEIGVTSVGTGGMGQRLALYQGRVFRVCE